MKFTLDIGVLKHTKELQSNNTITSPFTYYEIVW